MKNTFTVVGKRHPKIEAVDKVTGQLKYCGDMQFPKTLHVRILRSPHAHANILSIDTSRALQLKGVETVITHADVPKIPTMHQFLHLPTVMYFDSFLLESKVRHFGDRVAAVAAETPEIAEEALELIDVIYEPLPAVMDLTDSMSPASPAIHTNAWRGENPIEVSHNIVDQAEENFGNVEQGFAEADLIVENTYKTSRPNPAPLERTVVTCVPRSNGRLDVYGTTQSIHAMRKNIAASLGIPLHKVNCHWNYLGGAFGAHIHTGWIEPICAFLALKTGRPVRGEKSREEMFLAYGRHPMQIRLKTGVKKDGTFTAIEVDIIDDTGAYAFSGGSKMKLTAGFCLSMYNCANQRIKGKTVYTNTPSLCAMRGAGNPQAHWAVESQIDIIADRLGLDPLELRLKNHIREGQTFYGQSTDVVCDIISCGTEEVVNKGAAAIGWSTRSHTDTDIPYIKRGIGMARGFHTSGAGSSKPSKYILDYAGAIIKMTEDGTAVLMNASADAGGGNRSGYVAMVAEELGLGYEDVILADGDTNTTLFDVPTHASRGNYGTGLAVLQAAKNLKQRLLQWASLILEVPVDNLAAEAGKIFATDREDKHISIRELVEIAQMRSWGSAVGEASVRPEACPPHFIACFVEVHVDTRTGIVRVVNTVSGADVGTPINLNNVEGQMTGGMHMGLGYALLEETYFDPRQGHLLNPGFLDYKMLTFADMPPVTTIIADVIEPTGPFGAKGVGEGVTNPVAPAVANAIFNAVGIRLTDLPMTPEKILKAIHAKGN
ncbi:xanthine dehydrogenase family protein molybdopterin-binding subunit [bacterium]|nr:xanthine dehydrogenase family protein molybdopterin-binding subunit [bacterium]